MSFKDLKGKRAVRQGHNFRVDRTVGSEVEATPSDVSKTTSTAESGTPDCLSELEFDRGGPSTEVPDVGLNFESAEQENTTYAFDPSTLRVGKRKGRGRGLYARKALRAGEIIYKTPARPPATVLSTSLLSSHCSNCYLTPLEAARIGKREEEALKRCGGCKVLHYCSASCQVADWTLHKPECGTLQKLKELHKARHGKVEGFVPHESVRAIGRLFWAKRDGRRGWDEYQLLQSHLDPDADKLAKVREQVYRIAFYLGITQPGSLEAGGEMALSLLMQSFGVKGNAELEMMKIISRYQVNAFTLDSPDLSPLGVTVNPALGMANHSCDPNAVVVFPDGGGVGRLMAIRHIAADEEILICYTDIATPTHVRNGDLYERYAFRCACSACTEPFDRRWLVSHDRDIGCAGAMPDDIRWNRLQGTGKAATRCECGQVIAVDVSALCRDLQLGKSLLEADERGEYDGAQATLPTKALQECISRLADVLPPTCHPLIPLHRLATRLLTITPPSTLQELSFPLHHLNEAIKGAEGVYVPHHPTLAVLAAQKARLLAVNLGSVPTELSAEMQRGSRESRSEVDERGMLNELNRLKMAVVAYQDAIRKGEATFGTGGVISLGLRDELDGLQRELAMLHAR